LINNRLNAGKGCIIIRKPIIASNKKEFGFTCGLKLLIWLKGHRNEKLWPSNWVLDYPKGTLSNRFNLFFHPNYQAEIQFHPIFPFVQSVEKQRTVRLSRQTVLVGGIGLEPSNSESNVSVKKRNKIRKKIRTLISSLMGINRCYLSLNPLFSPLNRTVAYTKTAQHQVLAVFLGWMPPRESVPNYTLP
jgi:hypothetical protein